MKLLSVFRKSLLEQMRDPLVLGLSLVFAPFFVFLYSLFFPGGSTVYPVLVINDDRGAVRADGSWLRAGDDVVARINQVTYADGRPLLQARTVAGRAAAEPLLRDRQASVFVHVPAGFSAALQAARAGQAPDGVEITFGGDLTNPYYMVAAILATTAVDAYVQEAIGAQPPVRYAEAPLGAAAARSEFELYVPGIFVFAVILLVFTASMTVAREVEAGTVRRLKMTRMTALDLLGGITLALMLVSVLAVVLTFLTALALGFRSGGALGAAVLVGALTSLSVVGIGLMVACFAKSVAQAFVIANFPLGMLMAFSSAMFPIPRAPLFSLAGRPIGLYDILPATHAVAALNKLFTLGAGLGELGYELAALAVLSLAYFAAGVCLFQRTHLRPAHMC